MLARGGNDVISDTQLSDHLEGETGDDTAIVDRRDTVRNREDVHR